MVVWVVLKSPPLEAHKTGNEFVNETFVEIDSSNKNALRPVFLDRPFRVFEGHSSDVVALDWSQVNGLPYES